MSNTQKPKETKTGEELKKEAEALKIKEQKEAVEKARKEEEARLKKEEERLLKKGIATVEWQGQSRDYTKELHGANLVKLARQFAEKKGGIVK